MKKRYLLHPLFFAVYPILFFFAHNKAEVLPNVMIAPLVVSAGATVLLFCFLILVLRNPSKGSILCSLAVFMFFSYGHVVSLFPADFRFNVKQYEIGPHAILFTVLGILGLVGGFALLRLKRPNNCNKALTLISGALLLATLTEVISFEWKTGRLVALAATTPSMLPPARNAATDRDDLPDIYYLVFDRYAANKTLKIQLGFDNSEVTDFLEDKGFYVAYGSRANYPKSDLSLTSSLNLKHLTYLTKELGKDSPDQTVLHQMLNDHFVGRFLKQHGYRYVHIGSWYGPTATSLNADENIGWNYMGLNEFSVNLLETTAASPILAHIMVRPRKRIVHRLSNLYSLRQLQAVIRRPEADPRFIFAHILLPHVPFVFTAEGGLLSKEDEQARTPAENYIDQLRFTNAQIREIVEDIFTYSDKPPIIVIQADEGPQATIQELAGDDRFLTDWRTLSSRELRLKFGILNAYFLPGVKMRRTLYQDVTPVNTFRIIFNEYLGTGYELLPDSSYVFQDYDHLYKFSEVTQKMDSAGTAQLPSQRQ